MHARVDPAAREIVAEGRTFRFRLDLRGDMVIVSIDGRERPVRPLSWGEKVRMARFAAQAPEQVRAEVLRACADAGEELPPLDRDVLWALSVWLNEPPDAPSIPLDSRSLATVTLQLCRAMHLRPADFTSMAAADVEAMWLALGGAPTGEEMPETAFAEPFPSIGQRAASQGMETRILIVPDPEPGEVSPEATTDGRRENNPSSALHTPSPLPGDEKANQQTASRETKADARRESEPSSALRAPSPISGRERGNQQTTSRETKADARRESDTSSARPAPSPLSAGEKVNQQTTSRYSKADVRRESDPSSALHARSPLSGEEKGNQQATWRETKADVRRRESDVSSARPAPSPLGAGEKVNQQTTSREAKADVRRESDPSSALWPSSLLSGSEQGNGNVIAPLAVATSPQWEGGQGPGERRSRDGSSTRGFTGDDFTSRAVSTRRRTPLRFRMQPALADTSAALRGQAISPSHLGGHAATAAADHAEEVVSSFALFATAESPRALETELEPSATERQSLFDELADRLEQAAADMGITEG